MHVLHFTRLPASKVHIKSPANSSFPVVYMSMLDDIWCLKKYILKCRPSIGTNT